MVRRPWSQPETSTTTGHRKDMGDELPHHFTARRLTPYKPCPSTALSPPSPDCCCLPSWPVARSPSAPFNSPAPSSKPSPRGCHPRQGDRLLLGHVFPRRRTGQVQWRLGWPRRQHSRRARPLRSRGGLRHLWHPALPRPGFGCLHHRQPDHCRVPPPPGDSGPCSLRQRSARHRLTDRLQQRASARRFPLAVRDGS